MLGTAYLMAYEVLCLLVLAYYDFKTFSVPKVLGLLFLPLAGMAGYLYWIGTIPLVMAGLGLLAYAVTYLVVVRKWAPFDQVALLAVALTFPIQFFIALLLQQFLFVVITAIKKEKVRLPIMATYSPCFILAAVMLIALP